MKQTHKAIALAVLASAGLLGEEQARADETFVDTAAMQRHAGHDTPDVLPMSQALTASALLPYQRPVAQPYQPSLSGYALQEGLAAMGGYSSQGSVASQAVQAMSKSQEGDSVAALARHDRSGGYDDPNGTRILSGYQRESEYLGAHAWIGPGVSWDGLAVRDLMTHYLVPNYGVDVPYLDQDGARSVLSAKDRQGWFDQWKWTTGWSHIRAAADNYSLRSPGTVLQQFQTERSVEKSQLLLTHNAADWSLDAGGDLQLDQLNSARHDQEYGYGAISGQRFPRVVVWRGGLFTNYRQPLGPGSLQAGLRYDLLDNSVNGIDYQPNLSGANGAKFNYSPRQLWARYYGVTNPDSTEHLISGRLRYEQPLAEKTTGYADLSHMMRSPDQLERYYASGSGSAFGQVGNPGLKPERHHKAETGLNRSSSDYKGYGAASPVGAWKWTASVGADYVMNFIAVDRATGQQGIGQSDNTIIYRNVDAAKAVASGELQWMWAPSMAVRAVLSAERGENLSDHRPLYQMAPWEANLYYDLFQGQGAGAWNLGANARVVGSKDSFDKVMDVSGRGGGFTLFNLYGGVTIRDGISAVVELDNLLNRFVREPIQPFPAQPTSTILASPGRSLYGRIIVRY